MNKQDRNYNLYIQTESGELLTISRPLTIEFDIDRNSLVSANTCTIKLYNLAESTRKKIHRDYFRFDIKIKVRLDAGYGRNLSTIFKGNIAHAYSVREGVNYVTHLEAFDGGDSMIKSQTSASFPAGTPKSAIIASVLADFEGIEIGAIGNFQGNLTRGNSINGRTVDAAVDYTNGGFAIDLEKAYALGNDECIRGSISTITSQDGILATPVLEKTGLLLKVLFEPRVLIFQKLKIDSSTNKNFNGDYKVISIHHTGTISSAVNGECVTSLRLWYGTRGVNALKEIN